MYSDSTLYWLQVQVGFSPWIYIPLQIPSIYSFAPMHSILYNESQFQHLLKPPKAQLVPYNNIYCSFTTSMEVV